MRYTIIILTTFVAIVLTSHIRGCILTQKLSKNYRLTCGYFYKVSPSGWKSSTPRFYFYYVVDGQKKYKNQTLNVYTQDTLAFMRKCFPVAYIPDNLDFGLILVDKNDFSEVGIPRPDSLKWVDAYMRK